MDISKTIIECYQMIDPNGEEPLILSVAPIINITTDDINDESKLDSEFYTIDLAITAATLKKLNVIGTDIYFGTVEKLLSLPDTTSKGVCFYQICTWL